MDFTSLWAATNEHDGANGAGTEKLVKDTSLSASRRRTNSQLYVDTGLPVDQASPTVPPPPAANDFDMVSSFLSFLPSPTTATATTTAKRPSCGVVTMPPSSDERQAMFNPAVSCSSRPTTSTAPDDVVVATFQRSSRSSERRQQHPATIQSFLKKNGDNDVSPGQDQQQRSANKERRRRKESTRGDDDGKDDPTTTASDVATPATSALDAQLKQITSVLDSHLESIVGDLSKMDEKLRHVSSNMDRTTSANSTKNKDDDEEDAAVVVDKYATKEDDLYERKRSTSRTRSLSRSRSRGRSDRDVSGENRRGRNCGFELVLPPTVSREGPKETREEPRSSEVFLPRTSSKSKIPAAGERSSDQWKIPPSRRRSKLYDDSGNIVTPEHDRHERRQRTAKHGTSPPQVNRKSCENEQCCGQCGKTIPGDSTKKRHEPPSGRQSGDDDDGAHHHRRSQQNTIPTDDVPQAPEQAPQKRKEKRFFGLPGTIHFLGRTRRTDQTPEKSAIDLTPELTFSNSGTIPSSFSSDVLYASPSNMTNSSSFSKGTTAAGYKYRRDSIWNHRQDWNWFSHGRTNTIMTIVAVTLALALSIVSARSLHFVTLKKELSVSPYLLPIKDVGLMRIRMCQNMTALDRRQLRMVPSLEEGDEGFNATEVDGRPPFYFVEAESSSERGMDEAESMTTMKLLQPQKDQQRYLRRHAPLTAPREMHPTPDDVDLNAQLNQDFVSDTIAGGAKQFESDCQVFQLDVREVDDTLWNVARTFLHLAIVGGLFFLIMLLLATYWESINLKPIAIGLLVVYFCQSLSFFFFDSTLCRQYACQMNEGSISSVLASICWFLASLFTIRMEIVYQRVLKQRAKAHRRKLRQEYAEYKLEIKKYAQEHHDRHRQKKLMKRGSTGETADVGRSGSWNTPPPSPTMSRPESFTPGTVQEGSDDEGRIVNLASDDEISV